MHALQWHAVSHRSTDIAVSMMHEGRGPYTTLMYSGDQSLKLIIIRHFRCDLSSVKGRIKTPEGSADMLCHIRPRGGGVISSCVWRYRNISWNFAEIIAENISVKVSRVIGSFSLSLQIFSSAIQSVTCSQKLIEVNTSASNISQLSVSNCEAETENKILRFAIFLRNSQNWRLENIRKFHEINESF